MAKLREIDPDCPIDGDSVLDVAGMMIKVLNAGKPAYAAAVVYVEMSEDPGALSISCLERCTTLKQLDQIIAALQNVRASRAARETAASS